MQNNNNLSDFVFPNRILAARGAGMHTVSGLKEGTRLGRKRRLYWRHILLCEGGLGNEHFCCE